MSRLLRSIYRYNFRHTMATSSTSGARKLQLTDEVRFPVPWGHIAAKVWGHPGGRPVLGLHGWQDNANSFDALAPLLPTDFYFIVLDFPGHGRSSHRPPGLPNQFVEYLFDIKRVVDVLKWKRFSIIGHSMGGGIGVIFAGLFPELVERVVSLDLMAPVSRDPEMAPSLLRTSIEQTLGIETVNKEEKTYTPEAALKRLLDANASLTEEAGKILLERGTKVLEDGRVMFTRDHKVKTRTPLSFSNDHLLAFIKQMKCEYLALRFLHSPDFEKARRQQFSEAFSQSCSKFQYLELPGEHHLHLTSAQDVAPPICQFFNSPLSSAAPHISSKL